MISTTFSNIYKIIKDSQYQFINDKNKFITKLPKKSFLNNLSKSRFVSNMIFDLPSPDYVLISKVTKNKNKEQK